MTIKLAVLSGSRLFCEGVRKLVEGDTEISMVGGPDRSATLDELLDMKSDVILIDQQALFAVPRQDLTENGFPAKLIMVESRTEPSLIDGEIIELDIKGGARRHPFG